MASTLKPKTLSQRISSEQPYTTTVNSLVNSPATSDIWYSKNSSKMLNKDKTSNTEGRHNADIETSIAIQEAGPFAIPHKTLKARKST
jgi:hypothetical protein